MNLKWKRIYFFICKIINLRQMPILFDNFLGGCWKIHDFFVSINLYDKMFATFFNEN